MNNFSYVSLSCVFSKLTSAPSSETLNPSNSVGMVFSFCAFFSAIISSARNSTSSFSARKNNYNKLMRYQLFDENILIPKEKLLLATYIYISYVTKCSYIQNIRINTKR